MKNKIISHFYIKKARINSNGYAPIYLRITINGQRSEIATGIKALPETWDKASEKIIGRSEKVRSLNSQLANLLIKVERAFLILDDNNEKMTVRMLIHQIKGSEEKQQGIIEVFNKVLIRMEELIGIDYSKNTIKAYKSARNSVQGFVRVKMRCEDMGVMHIDKSFAQEYLNYLKITKGLKHNSAVKILKTLAAVMNYSTENGIIIKNPMEDFHCSFKENDRGYLTSEEVDKIYTKKFEISRLGKVRDVYIFQIYTGLAYIDLFNLTTDSLETEADGSIWISTKRQKSSSTSIIPLLPRAREIIEKYKEDYMCQLKGKILPVYSNQKMNSYLKEIADLCGIKKRMTTHLARHTFATTITLTNGVPIETVSKMLGHTNLKTTQIYAKIVKDKIAKDMKHLMNNDEK